MFKMKAWQWAGMTVLLAAAVLWFARVEIVERLTMSSRQAAVPTPVRPAEVARQQQAVSPRPTEGPKVTTPMAAEINLAIPFTPQAPFADWEQPYQDACEEAALLMAQRSLTGGSLSAEDARSEILRMVDFQEKNFGFYKDSNSAETARLAEQYFPEITAETVYDITADDIRRELVAGRPVVVLVDGRKLANPFYTAPGPDKHAVVIKGFTGDSFITNDPGTRRGADFVYSVETMMAALIDYDGGTPGTGMRTMIVMSLAASQN